MEQTTTTDWKTSGFFAQTATLNPRPSRGITGYIQKKPSAEELRGKLWEMPMTEVCKLYDVKPYTISKWAKSYGIEKPPHGRWYTSGTESRKRKESMDRREKKFSMSKEDLAKLLWEKPTEVIAKEHGVSGNCIAKHAKKHGLSKPPRGYWSGRRSPSNNLDS